MEYPEGKRAVTAYYDKWQPGAVLIEDASSGSSLIQESRNETR